MNCLVAYFFWAKKMENLLKYDLHFSTLREFFDDERIVVVSQERMAQDIDAVAAWIVELAMSPLGTIVEAPKPGTSVKPHVGYADKAKTILDDDIATTLTKTKKSLFGLIEGSSVRTLL